MIARPGMLALRLFAVLAGLLAGAGAAVCHAAPDTPKPKIERFEPEEALPGGFVVVFGENFGTDVDAFKVFVADKQSAILECEPTQMRIRIPLEVRAGKAKVEFKGEKHSFEHELKILDEKARAAKNAKEQEQEGATGNKRADGVVTLDPPQYMTDRGNTIIKVTGRCELPKDCRIDLALVLGDSGQLTVTSGGTKVREDARFETLMGPFPKPLAPGRYWVHADFKLATQDKPVKTAFKERFKDPKELKEHSSGKDHQPVDVGSTTDQDAFERELRGHFSGTVARLRELHKELEVAYGSAVRSKFKKGRDFDESAWEEWLRGKSFTGLAAAEQPKWLKDMRGKSDFLTTGGAFNEPKWRDWIDGKFAEAVEEQAKANQALLEKYLTLRDSEALNRLGGMIALTGSLAHHRSHELYQTANLTPPPQDLVPAVSAGQLQLDLKGVENRLEAEAAAAKAGQR